MCQSCMRVDVIVTCHLATRWIESSYFVILKACFPSDGQFLFATSDSWSQILVSERTQRTELVFVHRDGQILAVSKGYVFFDVILPHVTDCTEGAHRNKDVGKEVCDCEDHV